LLLTLLRSLVVIFLLVVFHLVFMLVLGGFLGTLLCIFAGRGRSAIIVPGPGKFDIACFGLEGLFDLWEEVDKGVELFDVESYSLGAEQG
jgi:hypothetical protein